MTVNQPTNQPDWRDFIELLPINQPAFHCIWRFRFVTYQSRAILSGHTDSTVIETLPVLPDNQSNSSTKNAPACRPPTRGHEVPVLPDNQSNSSTEKAPACRPPTRGHEVPVLPKLSNLLRNQRVPLYTV
jgi:hypothetical protein